MLHPERVSPVFSRYIHGSEGADKKKAYRFRFRIRQSGFLSTPAPARTPVREGGLQHGRSERRGRDGKAQDAALPVQLGLRKGAVHSLQNKGASQSDTGPATGFALMPEKASEPPH